MSTNSPRYHKRWRYDNARGIKRCIDPTPVHRHLTHLLALGMSRKAIAEAAGVSATQVGNILRVDAPPTVTRRIAQLILAVTADDVRARQRPRGFVPAVGVRRRIQALQAIGHSAATIADAADLTLPIVHNLVNQTGDWVTAANRDAIHRAYAALWNQPGQSRAVRTRSARKGWAPPLAWDDDSIDNPAAQPDLGEQTPPRGTRRFHLEDVEFLLEHEPYATAQQIAERLGVGRDAIQQACRRAGRDDLTHQLARNARVHQEGTAA